MFFLVSDIRKRQCFNGFLARYAEISVNVGGRAEGAVIIDDDVHKCQFLLRAAVQNSAVDAENLRFCSNCDNDEDYE